MTGGGVVLPLLDNHGLEVLALLHLGLDVCNDARKVWHVLSDYQCPECAFMVGDRTSSGLVHSSLGRSW